MIEEDIFTPLNLFFADLHQPPTESERTFYAALIASAQEGHLCLDLDQIALTDPHLKMKILQGAKTASSPYIRRQGALCYLEKNYMDETRILNHLRQLSFPVKPLDFPPPEGLTPEQQQALAVALSNTLSVIEGGPGTGKTFLTSHLVKAMGSSARIILAAPKGKAAARLKQFNPQATCGTLHSILGIKSERQLARGSSYVQADLIIIDESSMIDAKLLAFFLGSLQRGQRVVFLGDGHQLPPVESGSLFSDLVDLLPTAHLHKCLRSDRLEVLQLAQQVLAGEKVRPHEPLSIDFILRKAVDNFPHPSSEEIISDIHRFCMLSPVREGPFGVNQLNQQIFQLLSKRMKPEEKLAVPILITRTDYEAGLYNGEVGILWRDRQKPLFAEFNQRKIPASLLPSYELGYVLSVHKSQGSEFDHVVAILPPGSETFGREVLYTAVTRAKLSVILCGNEETVQKTIGYSSQRRSGLKLRWNQKGQQELAL